MAAYHTLSLFVLIGVTYDQEFSQCTHLASDGLIHYGD